LQGSSGVHILLVQHTRCPEHGELVHSSRTHHHLLETHADPYPSVSDGTRDASAEEGHEHCSLSAHRRDALVSFAETGALARILEAPHDVMLADAFVLADSVRFRVAPKTSPPA